MIHLNNAERFVIASSIFLQRYKNIMLAVWYENILSVHHIGTLLPIRYEHSYYLLNDYSSDIPPLNKDRNFIETK